MTKISISPQLVEQTLAFLRAAGDQNSEGVVLWLAVKSPYPVAVVEVFVPEQEASWGNFRIPRKAMADLMRHLRTSRMFIAAQVHSHPFEAFHSPIDDEWAIVRHEGAMSLVLPNFARETSVDSFVSDTAIFELSNENKWIEQDLTNYMEINE